MAQYGYSTPYSGQQVAPLPPGYMEAATASGRNLAMGITAIGQGLGKALERYTENKKAHEAADQTNAAVTQMFLQQMENDPKVQAVRYFEDTGQLPTGVDETTLKSYEAQMKRDAGMISNLVGSSAKWADMSLTKKKTALGDTVTMLNQYRTNQQDDFKNEAARQQLQKGRYELEDILSKRKQNEILSGAIQYGLDQPTTTTQTEQVTTEVPGAPLPPMPGENIPATQVPPTFNEQGYIEALRRYKETTTPEVNIADIKAQLAQLEPMASETPRQWQIPTLKGGMGGMSSAVDRATITETPQQIAGRIAEVIPKVRALRSQLESAQKQPLEMPRREQFLTQVDAQPSAMPAPLSAPLTVTRNVPTQVPISYEDQSRRLTQYLVQQGAKPETLAMVPQILSMVGQRMPTRVEQVGNIGSVIRFGDKEQFVPAQQTNISDILKVKGLTVDFPEFRGTAPTEAEAAKFRDQYSSVLESRKAISDLLDIAKMGTAMQQTPEIKTKANSLVSGLRGVERINIIGPGTITPEDFKLLNSVIPDPTAIFSLKKSNIQAFETMLQKSARAIESKAKAIGLETIRAQTQPVTGASSGNFKLVIGKGIQPIQ
jgi:hypothetical protein